MSADPIKGKTVRWTYDDGPMKGQTPWGAMSGQDKLVVARTR